MEALTKLLNALNPIERRQLHLYEEASFNLRSFAAKAQLSLLDAAAFVSQPSIEDVLALLDVVVFRSFQRAAATARTVVLETLRSALSATTDLIEARRVATLLLRCAGRAPTKSTSPDTPPEDTPENPRGSPPQGNRPSTPTPTSPGTPAAPSHTRGVKNFGEASPKLATDNTPSARRASSGLSSKLHSLAAGQTQNALAATPRQLQLHCGTQSQSPIQSRLLNLVGRPLGIAAAA